MSLNRKQWLVNTLAFVLVCVGFLLMSGNASAADYEHKMEIGPSTQTGDPEEQIQYTITITNEGDLDDTYDLTVINSTVPTGYTVYIIPIELSVDEGEEGTATLFVKIANRTTSTGAASTTSASTPTMSIRRAAPAATASAAPAAPLGRATGAR